MDFIVLDLETTGLDATSAEILEIGITEVKNGKIVRSFSRLVKPKNGIPEKITELTGISEDDVKDAKTLDEVIYKFRDYIGDNLVICHNARFDIGFINYNLVKFGLEKIQKTNYRCTLKMIKAMRERGLYAGENNKLGTVAAYYGIELKNAHRADADTLATAKVYLRIIDEYEREIGFGQESLF